MSDEDGIRVESDSATRVNDGKTMYHRETTTIRRDGVSHDVEGHGAGSRKVERFHIRSREITGWELVKVLRKRATEFANRPMRPIEKGPRAIDPDAPDLCPVCRNDNDAVTECWRCDGVGYVVLDVQDYT